MSRKSKFEEEAKTKPGRRRSAVASAPPEGRGGSALAAKRKASEAPTQPPPPPDEAIEVTAPKNVKVSGVRPKRVPRPSAAMIDEVTADLTKDPRRDDDD